MYEPLGTRIHPFLSANERKSGKYKPQNNSTSHSDTIHAGADDQQVKNSLCTLLNRAFIFINSMNLIFLYPNKSSSFTEIPHAVCDKFKFLKTKREIYHTHNNILIV